jgi:hypothetical protein
LESLSINNTNEVAGVTTFVQEACEAVDVLGADYVRMTHAVDQPALQDLKTYFARPRMMAHGTLATGLRNNVIKNDMAPSDVFESIFPDGAKRLQGAYGVRFKMVFTLQVAANPFHQGVLALAWQYRSDSVAGTSSFSRWMHSNLVTELPHVRMDLSSTTMVVLNVPFMYHREFVESTSDDRLGTISLNYILPLATGTGSVPPTYKLFLHLEDIELIGVSYAKASTVTVQSGRKMKPMDQEFEDEAYPFSSSLSSLSRSVKWVGKGIPMLSSIAGPASWWLQKAAGAVRAFGYAKPQIQEPPIRNLPGDCAGEQNIDVPSATFVVGPCASNSLRVGPEFGGSEVDEMSLAYVTSRYSQICTATIDSSTAQNAVVYGTQISPSWFWFRAPSSLPAGNIKPPDVADASSNAFMPSNVFFWASFFRMWRGSFRFRFTFSKTKHHGGRVMVGFQPDYTIFPLTSAFGGTTATVSSPEVDADGNLQPFGHTAIFDLRDGNVFEFDVPYLSPRPFVQFTDTVGSLTVSILDPLQAPSVVSPSINLLVEVCALGDFELACPVGPAYPVHVTGTPKLQSGRVLSVYKDDISQYTTGEVITSAKQLIMMPHSIELGVIPASYTNSFDIAPWYYYPSLSALIPSVMPLPPTAFSIGGTIASCYAYFRGGTDVHLYPGGTSLTAYAYGAPGNYSATSDTMTVRNRSGSSAPKIFATAGTPLHARFPAYHSNARLPNGVLAGVSWNPQFVAGAPASGDILGAATRDGPISIPRVKLINGPSDTTAVLSRAAADDAMCAHYLGPPPLFLPAASSTGSYDTAMVL